MIRNNKTPGLQHMGPQEHCNAPPRRVFVNEARNGYHGLGSKDRYVSRNEGITKNGNNRSLRSLTSNNQKVEGKKLQRVDSQKYIRNVYNPEKTEASNAEDPYQTAECYGLSGSVKQAFSRNQKNGQTVCKNISSLQSYLIKKAPKVPSEIKKGIPVN